MPRARSIPIYLYSLNLRSGNNVLDYRDFFAQLSALDPIATTYELSRDVSFALDLDETEASAKEHGQHPENDSLQRVFVGSVIAGSPGDVPLFFDYTTGRTETGTTPEGKWLARISHIVVSISADYRYLALEGGRNGVTVARLSKYLTLLAESITGLRNVEFDIIPVQSDSLRTEIESFVRIKQASAIVTRPNTDWNDFSSSLTQLAEESAGHKAEAVVTAARGDSLAKSKGIIGTILQSLSSNTPSISRFRVSGRKPNSKTDTTITSEKHQKRAFARVPDQADPTVSSVAIYGEAQELIRTQLPDDSQVESTPASTSAGGDGEHEAKE